VSSGIPNSSGIIASAKIDGTRGELFLEGAGFALKWVEA
jgi:hypothetical protein